MAEDLRLFLQTAGGTVSPAAPAVPVSTPPGSTLEAAPLPPTSRQSDSDQRPIKIVPEGAAILRRARCRLLPGTASRTSGPGRTAREHPVLEAKDRADRPRPDLQGGADLRSLGLRQVVAGQGRTAAPAGQARPSGLRRGDRRRRPKPGCSRACGRRVPNCPQGLGLVDSLANLRRGRILPPERKVLLVLDQFEQWLHAKRGEENTELVAALRHCDGEHVQAVVLVRDDFWLAASRFMRDLEIRLARRGEHRRRRSLRSPPCQESADGIRAGLRDVARKHRRSHQRPERLSGSSRFPGLPRTARSSPCGWLSSPR